MLLQHTACSFGWTLKLSLGLEAEERPGAANRHSSTTLQLLSRLVTPQAKHLSRRPAWQFSSQRKGLFLTSIFAFWANKHLLVSHFPKLVLEDVRMDEQPDALRYSCSLVLARVWMQLLTFSQQSCLCSAVLNNVTVHYIYCQATSPTNLVDVKSFRQNRPVSFWKLLSDGCARNEGKTDQSLMIAFIRKLFLRFCVVCFVFVYKNFNYMEF